MAYQYSTFQYDAHGKGRSISAAEIILRLDPSCAVQHAHIGEVWRVCQSGISYSGEDGDVLSAAAAELWKGPREPATHESAWVARWLNCPAHIADAIRWAKATAPAQPQSAPPAAYAEDLTPIGLQLVIPGCERRPEPGKAAPAQLSLW